jgi:signal transduction histidine kinase
VRRLSLATRAFLFSFVPVCVVLGATFFTLNAVVHDKIRHDLREALQVSDALLNRLSIQYSHRSAKLVAALTESAGLKAAIGLLTETGTEPEARDQVRATIEAQLQELQTLSGCDLVGVSDAAGRTVAAVGLPEIPASSLSALPLQSGLADIRGVLYQLEIVPINIEGERIASLTLGTRFELNRFPLAGDAVLLHQGKVVQSTFPLSRNAFLENQLRLLCPDTASTCEMSVKDDSYVISPLQRAQLGKDYQLLGFRSLEKPVRETMAAVMWILFEVGAGGIALALLSCLMTSRSLSQPIRKLVLQLKGREAHSHPPAHLTIGNGAYELNLLVDAFNRVSEAEHHARRELEEAKNAAECASRLKTEFLTNVTHELRTPMNGVLGMTDLLLTTSLDAEQQEYANSARQSAHSLLALINDVLDFSETETGQLSLSSAPFDLPQVVFSVVEELRAQSHKKGICVYARYASRAPDTFAGDAKRIRQVLIKLLENAIKFTEHGHVTVAVVCLGGTKSCALMKIAVEDSGIGISSENLQLIFQRFTQADGSLTRRRGGTGLGLALAKQLIELMGGSIGVESRLGTGSTFWFTLPLEIYRFDNTPLQIESAGNVLVHSPS